MESLSYGFEGRGLLFTDDTDFQVDGLLRSRNLLKKWDEESLSHPTRDAYESMGFAESVLHDTTKRSLPNNHQFLESSCDDTNHHSGESQQSVSPPSLSSFLELNTRFSTSVNKANNEKSIKDNSSRFTARNAVLSSPERSVSAKRARISNSQSQIPTCQVYGCNMDLSSSKDYHKRHKVCDLHSKTAVVIVNGIQQRFCQQCSRFHILAEFDEGKRSCRKRLAGHNERRRKPQFDTHLGSTYLTTDVSPHTSFLFSRILPDGYFGPQCNGPTNHLKLEDEPSLISQLALHMKFGQPLPKSVMRFHGIGKQYPSKNCLNTPLSVQELSSGSNPSNALSLLSARSQSLSRNSSGVSMVHPMISKENHRNHTNLFSGQNSAKCLQKNMSQNIDSSGVYQERLVAGPTAGVSVGFGISQNNEFSQGANNVDLHELSLNLQRVEQQKYNAQVKVEDSVFCNSTLLER